MRVVLYIIVIHFSYHDYDLRDKFENSIKLNNGIFPWYYHKVHGARRSFTHIWVDVFGIFFRVDIPAYPQVALSSRMVEFYYHPGD